MTLDSLKEHKTKRVKGSVLFTVLVVLMVLIVFLVGTLGIATAANRRAQNAFTSSQAQYTARSVVDGVVVAMQNVEDFKKAIDALPDYDAADPDKSKMIMDGSQVTLPTDQHYGTVQEVEVARQPSQYSFDETKQLWTEVNVLKVTATVRSGKEVSSYSTYITSALEAKETVIPPSGDRVLSGGTAAISTPSLSVGANVSMYGGAAVGFDITKLLNTTVDPYTYTFDPTQVSSGNANDSNVIEAPFSVYGSFELNGSDTTKIIFPSVGTGMTIWGDLGFQNGCVFGSGNNSLKTATAVNYSEMPFVYVEGMMKFYNNNANTCQMTGGDFPLMFVVGGIEQSSSANYRIPGDVYCLDTGTTTLRFNESSILNAWTGNLVNGTNNDLDYHCGGYYSPGSLSMEGTGTLTFNGDVVIDGDLTLKQSIVCNSDLIVMGNIIKENDAHTLKVNGTLYYNTAEGALTGVDPDDVDINDSADYTTSACYTSNKAVYDSLAAKYSGNAAVWNGLRKNMTNKTATSIAYNVYPWYMQKTWMLGLYDDATVDIKAFSEYNTVPRQFVDIATDVAKSQYDSIKSACITSLPDAFASVDPIIIDKPGTYVPTVDHPYMTITKETLHHEDWGDWTSTNWTANTEADATTGYEIVIDLANSELDEAWLVIEDGVWFNNKPFCIVMNDLDASGQYMENKVLNILFTGDSGADNQFQGFFTKYYQQNFINKGGNFYIPTGVACPVAATELKKPNIYIYSDVFPYVENADGTVSMKAGVDYASFTMATNDTFFVSAYAFAPGLQMNINKANNGSLTDNVLYYNGSPVVNTSTKANNCGGVSVIGGLLLAESSVGGAGKPTVIYYPSDPTIIPGSAGIVQDNKLQWFEEYQQNSYDAY